MKKTYFNPEATIMTVASEDIVRTSGPLDVIQGPADGYDDKADIGDLF